MTLAYVLGRLVTVGDAAMAEAVVRLRAAGCVFAEDEAAVLGEAAHDDTALAALVARRAEGEPLEQVVGYADFCGVRIHLLPGVFVPRVRSELLVRIGTEAAKGTERRPTVVDLCCGSGALGLAVRHHLPDIDLHAADLDPTAVTCARLNFARPAAGNKNDPRNTEEKNVYQGNLFDALPHYLKGHVDVLIANVPYVATDHIPLLPSEAKDHEPHTALDGGPDGLSVFRAVAADAAAWLSPGGILLSEITDAQTVAATEAVQAAGLDVAVIYDDDLEAQVIQGTRKL
jgi:release factor glutamine methyltransferase